MPEAMIAGIKKRALEDKQRRQLKQNLQAYGGIGPGPLGQPGQMIDGAWHGGRTHQIGHKAASKRLTSLVRKGANSGGPDAFFTMLEEHGRNPRMFDGLTLGGVKFGPDVSIISKIAALQTMMESAGIQGFQSGGYYSPIAESGLSRKKLDKIIRKHDYLPMMPGQRVH